MEEIGVIKDIDGRFAIVAVKKKSACEGCAGVSLCESSNEEYSIVKAVNLIDAQKGDSVIISFDTVTYIKGSLLVYAMPVILMVIGAILGKTYLSSLLTFIDPEGLSAISGFLFLSIGLILVKLISLYFEKKKSFIPAVIKKS